MDRPTSAVLMVFLCPVKEYEAHSVLNAMESKENTGYDDSEATMHFDQ